MYHYTIQVLAMDFPGQVDDLILPLLAWVWQQQPDLLLNPDNNRKVEFDADIVNDDVADILFKVPVWERVMVTDDNGEQHKVTPLIETKRGIGYMIREPRVSA